jgi:hypothetical protein
MARPRPTNLPGGGGGTRGVDAAVRQELPARPDFRKAMRPLYYSNKYHVISSRTPGKWRYFDVVLVEKTASGSYFKQAATIIRAWRSRYGDGKPGTPYDLALKEAYALRGELAGYPVQDFSDGTDHVPAEE